MRILHCCLAAFYIDGYGYQENILPKMHKLQGYDVKIIASTETYIKNKKLGYTQPKQYINEDGISVTRIPYNNLFLKRTARKLRLYSGLKKLLFDFSPDIIFLHDVQFLSVKDIIAFVKKNPKTTIYADSHTDYINSARTWVSKNILHKIIYRYCATLIEPYTKRFYGTLPIRNIFLEEVYKIPKNKISLLEFGADDSLYDYSQKDIIKNRIRKELNLNNRDFVIITGGKIDKRKNIDLLMEAISLISAKVIKLIVFGIPNDEMKNEIFRLAKNANIIYLGWLEPKKIYEYLFASDLAFFPGTHSVVWEQVVGIGLPAVFKKWDKIEHIDVGGNCLLLEDISVKSIKKTILNLYSNKGMIDNMKKIAEEKGIKRFTYSEIAKRAIEK